MGRHEGITANRSNEIDFEKEALKESHKKSFLDRIYDNVMGGLIDSRRKKMQFGAMIKALFVMIGSLVYFKIVRVKMLPFDNKSELQIMIDLDEGTPLATTTKIAKALGDHLLTVPEVENYQIYAGTSAPFNFNGLVRHYFLRNSPHQGDVQVNLVDKGERRHQSHDSRRD
jgi:multidrug efflux pump subunit AcrB